jgi:hypothetical protein
MRTGGGRGPRAPLETRARGSRALGALAIAINPRSGTRGLDLEEDNAGAWWCATAGEGDDEQIRRLLHYVFILLFLKSTEDYRNLANSN